VTIPGPEPDVPSLVSPADGRPPNAVLRLVAGIGNRFHSTVDSRVAEGPEADYWERVRRGVVGVVGALTDGLHLGREIRESEYVGRLDRAPDDAEGLLWTNGFVRNPLSALKTRDGTPEIGSWAHREGPDAERQVHVMLFEGSAGGVDVYAHEEPSSINPSTAVRHYEGTDQRVDVGVDRVRAMLPVSSPTGATAGPAEGTVVETGRLLDRLVRGVETGRAVGARTPGESTGRSVD